MSRVTTPVVATITAQNVFTDELEVRAEKRISVSVADVSDSTVTLQRQLDGTNWRDIQSFTAAVELTYRADEKCVMRLGIKTGNYGSDTVVCRLGG